PDFAAVLGGAYGAAPREADFRQDAAVQQAINAWVSERTRGHIKELPIRTDGDTRMVLASAIYFQGAWQKPFSPRDTRAGLFRLPRSKSVKVQMMRQQSSFPYHADKEVQA